VIVRIMGEGQLRIADEHKDAEVDLNRLPGLQTWPGDGGIFHNYGLTHTAHPETGKRNLGLYRLQQHSPNTLGMHWQIHKDSTAHHAVAERLGQRLPVAIAFGCDPVVSYSASAPLPASTTGCTPTPTMSGSSFSKALTSIETRRARSAAAALGKSWR
jgi:UbiD family decarboxylase